MSHAAVEVVKNISFTLEAMAALKTSRSIFFGEGSLALATGTNSASENWAFFPPCASRAIEEKVVKRVCAFFENLGQPFIWPLFPETAAAGRVLEEAGMKARGELLAMVCPKFSPEKNNIIAPLTFEINKKTDAWAEVAWMAFGSSAGVPDSFVRLARGLRDNKDFSLILAKRGDLPVGTVMLSLSGESAGIYYFATLPEERKKGVGDAMLHEASRLTFERGCCALTLQATPMGAPFYASRGFKPLFGLPVYSFSEEVF